MTAIYSKAPNYKNKSSIFSGTVAGVMASGYYLAKEILKHKGIDLKKRFYGILCLMWV